MSDKKNIDRLFQEKLKDFEVTPKGSVWNNISTELQNTGNSKNGIPIWWRVAGTAAALLLLFTFSQLIYNNNSTTTTQEIIVDDDFKTDNLNKNLENSIIKENEVVEGENDSERLKTESYDVPSNNSVANTDNDSIENYIPTNKNKNNFASTKNDNSNSNLSQRKDEGNTLNKVKTDIILNSIDNSKIVNTAIETNLTTSTVNLNTFNSLETNIIIKTGKLSLIDEIAANEDNDIEDPTEEFERWKAASHIAPVYFNAFGKGSSIHPQFNNNSKSGDINMSYGVSGSFAINKKLSIRTGINKVNLGYSTNDVIVFNNIGASTDTDTQLLRNIKMTEAAQNLSFISAEEFNFAQVPGILNNFIDSSIDQKLGFIEIPLELEYKLLDRKTNIRVIGGFSALFLNENEVFSVLDGRSTLLGEATNINKTSFSANFGFGFDFKISDKFNLNFEPIFKYQLNTFNETSGNFNPFFIGVYSGLSFKF